MSDPEALSPIDRTLRRAAAALQEAEVPFLLGGSLACWARGGPRVENDVDLMVAPQDAERALAALADADMRTERPPEDWLVKAYDQDVCVDIIFAPMGVPITRERIAQAEELRVLAITIRVMTVDDVLVSRLLSMDEHRIDYTPLVAIARSLREQINWPGLASRVQESPYARCLFILLEDLGIIATAGREASEVRVHRLGLS